MLWESQQISATSSRDAQGGAGPGLVSNGSRSALGYQSGRAALKPSGPAERTDIAALLRVPPGTTPVVVLSLPPVNVAATAILDLANPVGLPTQLANVNARFVHLVVGGQSTWLDLGAAGNPTVMAGLTQNLLGSDGALRGDVNLATWFTWDGTDIVAGVSRTDVTLNGDVASAETTLQSSNERSNKREPNDGLGGTMDALWSFMNGGSTELEAKGDKPGAWYNGIRLEGDRENPSVVMQRSPKDTRTGPLPQLSLADYRAMLVRDFDYNGAISRFQALGGLPAFEKALLDRHPDGDPALLKVVAREVWSYATTGMDTRGVTNISELQGYLYTFDPEIQVSSDANTVLSGTFNAGTPESPLILPKGDGKHGRSTILTTRHLLANVRFEELAPTRTPTIKPGPLFGDNDRFLRDNSPSMAPAWGLVCDGVDQQLGRGAYDPSGATPSTNTGVVGTFDHTTLRLIGAGAQSNPNISPTTSRVLNFGQVLTDAYAKLSPNGTRAEAQAFAALLGFTGPLNQLFSVSGGRYVLDAAAAQAFLGDVGNVDNGADGESGLKAILVALLYDPALSTPVNGVMPRLNAVADEAEQGLEYLELTKAIATALGVEVRLIAAPTGATATSFNPATDLAVIPLQSMQVQNTGTGLVLKADVTQGGVTTPGATIPLKYGPRGTTPVDPAHPYQKGWAPLVNGQHTAGAIH